MDNPYTTSKTLLLCKRDFFLLPLYGKITRKWFICYNWSQANKIPFLRGKQEVKVIQRKSSSSWGCEVTVCPFGFSCLGFNLANTSVILYRERLYLPFLKSWMAKINTLMLRVKYYIYWMYLILGTSLQNRWILYLTILQWKWVHVFSGKTPCVYLLFFIRQIVSEQSGNNGVLTWWWWWWLVTLPTV